MPSGKGMTAEVYLHKATGRWRWRLLANNKRPVATSAQGYSRKDAATTAVTNVVSGLRYHQVRIVTL